ncbi:MAG: hypothetical protein WB760_30800 [Xanthobacteraceae bacterium]
MAKRTIGDYHRAVSETVARFDGFVAKYMGDGVLIYDPGRHARLLGNTGISRGLTS